MGILECLLVIALGLKMAGIAFASVGYFTIVGCYLGAVALMFLTVLLFIGLANKEA